ncbi:MAG: 4Fe-4S ferredoxin [Nitrososphaerota archaeon]|jgi:Fe-S-cluster-containing hydrogenase component 2|nr:4Fe-4S ferredoxin [Nitrososphaerota archaeon]
MPAYRNVRLCGKDCLCLYVCPTGATDTENSIIDVAKCIPGCMACVDACPSSAISMLPDKYPPPQIKMDTVIMAQRVLGQSKVQQEKIAETIATLSDSPVTRQFAKAIAKSNRCMAEDILREAGYMLPQSTKVRKLIEILIENAPAGFPKDAAELLLNKLQKIVV